MFACIYATYVSQDRKIQETQLQNIADSIAENIIVAEQTNIAPIELKNMLDILATKRKAHQIIVIQDTAIIDNLHDVIDDRLELHLSDQRLIFYRQLDSTFKPISYTEFDDQFLYLNKAGKLSIFIILDKTASKMATPNILSDITLIFSAGMMIIVTLLYLLQRHLLLLPLEKITQHLKKQSETETVSTIPFLGNDELGELVKHYNVLIETKIKYAQELTESRQHIYGITNTAPVLLSYVGPDLKFRFVNQIHEDWFGIPLDVFVNTTLEDILGSHAFDIIKPEVDKVLLGEHANFESSIPYQYLEDKSVHINFVPNKKTDGSIDGFFICIEDISEARRNETKLADYAQRLEFREFALEEEKTVAEQALKIKSEFLASMSHEIRTPMNGVLGMLHLLTETNLNDDQKTKANLAKTSAESLLNLINDILDFSKVESGKLEIEKIDFNLIELLENTTEGLSKLAEDKSISLLLDTSKINHVMLKGDPNRLRQILNNLLSNSIKFTHQGNVTCSAHLYEDMPGQYNLICSVSDTGIGIEKHKLDAIFESFTQVDASTTRQYGGTGLGLSIAKKLCQLMGGNIQASSTPNQGSKFTFTIRLEESTRYNDITYQTNLNHSRCIIVDSNQSNAKNTAKQLAKWGAEVKEVSSFEHGLIAIKDALSVPGDTTVFVCLDIAGKSGLEFIKEAKHATRGKNVSFVLITPLSFNQTDNQINELGISSTFYKPITKIKLFNAIQTTQQIDAKAEPNQTTETSIDKTAIENTTLPTDKRILLVEDTPINQLVVKGILSTLGLTCDVADNGLLALEHLNAADNYDLILMDCQMPEMDGYEATHAIREGKAGDNYLSIPIIAMTANAMKGDEEACLQAGMDDYMSKPIDAQIIQEKVTKWLNT